MFKLVSNKDGSYPKFHGSFETYAPCSYVVINSDKEVVGYVDQHPHYHLSNLNPAYSGYDKVWVAYNDKGYQVAANQYLKELKLHIQHCWDDLTPSFAPGEIG